MESTHTVRRRRRPERDVTGLPYAELTAGHQGHPPIYAQLVAEWRSQGRTVPEGREVFEVLWASFAAAGPLESELWPVGSWADRHRGDPSADRRSRDLPADRQPVEPPLRPSGTGTGRGSGETEAGGSETGEGATGETEPGEKGTAGRRADTVPAVPVPRGLPV